uniref:Uncharacterized protein n=1 Tax=Nymphaea colorata TaxID=210225 RepID=A0A5K1C2B9_9MAGN
MAIVNPQWNAIASLVSVQLDENNYLLWKSQLCSAMYSQDLLRYVDGSSTLPEKLNANSIEINLEYIKWKRSDQLALSWILSTVSESILTQIISYDIACEAWVALANAHASHSNICILQLKRDLQNAKKNDKSMLEYLNHVRFLVDSLQAMNEIVSDLDLVLHTLNGLSSEYESFITTITMSKILPTPSELHDLLLNQERQLQLLAPKIPAQVESSATAFFTQLGGYGGRENYGSRVANSGRNGHGGRSCGRNSYPTGQSTPGQKNSENQ